MVQHIAITRVVVEIQFMKISIILGCATDVAVFAAKLIGFIVFFQFCFVFKYFLAIITFIFMGRFGLALVLVLLLVWRVIGGQVCRTI